MCRFPMNFFAMLFTNRRSRRSGLGRDPQGAVSIIFATTAVPLMMAVGLSVDYSFYIQAQSQLSLAADCGAIHAVRVASSNYLSGLTYALAGVNGAQAGQQWFNAQLGILQTGTVTNLNIPPVPFNTTTSTFTSTVSYTASVPTHFGGLFHIKTWNAVGSASATIATNSFVNVDFLLDNSSSMLIGATEGDIQRLAALLVNVPGVVMPQSANNLGQYPCAFACHWSANPFVPDYYTVARKQLPNLQLRWDVLQSATQVAINQMIALEGFPNQFGVGVFSFGDPTYFPLKTIVPEGFTNLSAAIPFVQANTTPVVIDNGNTDFPSTMTAMNAITTQAGDGTTSLTPRKALIIVTDGMADYGSRSIPTTEGPMNPANCQAMKNKGYTVYVLYTTYSTDYPQVLLFNQALAPYINGTASPAMAASLQACATIPDDFISASTPAEIQTGLSKLLSVAVGSPARLTN